MGGEESRTKPQRRLGSAVVRQGCACPGKGRWQGAEAGRETAHRSEEEARWSKEERLQNDDPLKEP